MNNIITSQSIQSTVTAVTALDTAIKASIETHDAHLKASVPYEAALALSKRNKSRAALVAALQPAYEVTRKASSDAVTTLINAKNVVKSIEASAALNVALHTAKVNGTFTAQQADLLGTVKHALDTVSGNGHAWTSINVGTQQVVLKVQRDYYHGFTLGTVEVGFQGKYSNEEKDVRFIDPVRVVASYQNARYDLSTTCFTVEARLAPAIAAAYAAAADLVYVLNVTAADVRAAIERVDSTVDAELDAAEALRAIRQGNAENAARHEANEAAAK